MDSINGETITYVDDSWPEWGVAYHWSDARRVAYCETDRGTKLEMVHRPQWGVACYMNGEIQSCEADEKIYHEALVHPAMAHTTPRRVLILGGGEGATAREVLKWPSVEQVDMYEWDQEVVEMFRTSYPQWAKGAWADSRLTIHYEDVFERVRQGPPPVPYDVIVVDLFEPSKDDTMWCLFTQLATDWLHPQGTMTMYAGIRNMFSDIHPSAQWLTDSRIETYRRQGMEMEDVLTGRDVYSYKVFIPSFLGESMFLLLAPVSHNGRWQECPSSHLSEEVWKSYHTWNDYGREDGVLHGV